MASSSIYTNHMSNINEQMLENMSAANRKFYGNPTNFNSLPINYSLFTQQHDHQKLATDMLRQQNDYRQNQTTQAGNHFTFNQSITHVNLVNNRYPINLPSQPTYAQENSYPIHQENLNMNVSHASTNIHPPNLFYKPETSSAYEDHVAYTAPSSLMNSTNSIHPADHMNYTPTQENFALKNNDQSNNDFNSINYNKFAMTMNSMNPTNDIQQQQRAKNDFSSQPYFTDHNVINSSNNNANNIFPPFSNNMDKLTNIFVPTNFHKSRDHDIEQVDDTQKCKNTIEGTKTSVRRFKKWYKERYNKELDMNSVNRFNAPELLKDFFLDIRDTRPGRVGNEYEPVTLTTYRNGLRRYFLYRKAPPAADNFDLTDKTFDLVNRHLVTKRDDLKRSGKGNHPNAIESITPEQLEKMWAAGAIGTHAPRPLLRLMWWYNTVLHGVRGRMAHHDLTTDDFLIQRALDGKLLMEYTKNKSEINSLNEDMNSKLEPPKKKRFKGLAKQTDGGERDPIRAFEIFKTHRPQGISSFYLTPKHKPKGNIWFNKVPMGKNSIGRIMREIKAISNI